MIFYIYNIGVDLYNGFNGLRHRINWTYFTVLNGLAHPLYSIENIAQVDLLIIDDFGLMNLDVEKCRHLFDILDSRESRKSTVIVSQIPVKEWYDLFKDCTYADACLDRVLCKAYRLEFKGESLRNQKF